MATRPIADFYAYRKKLQGFVDRSVGVIQHFLLKRTESRSEPLKSLIFTDGEDVRVLRAVQMLIHDRIAKPFLIGNRQSIERLAQDNGLNLDFDQTVTVLDLNSYERYSELAHEYHQIAGRTGVSPEYAEVLLRNDNVLASGMLLRNGIVDGMLCGLNTSTSLDMQKLELVIGIREGISAPIGVNVVLLAGQPIFIADTMVAVNPDAERVAEIANLASKIVSDFDIEPKVALISHGSFGSSVLESSIKMSKATQLLKQRFPELQVEGEMTPEVALNERLREKLLPGNCLSGQANLLIMPNMDSANVAYRLLKTAYRDGFTVGPIFSGFNKSVNILSKFATVRNIYNMGVIAVNRMKF